MESAGVLWTDLDYCIQMVFGGCCGCTDISKSCHESLNDPRQRRINLGRRLGGLSTFLGWGPMGTLLFNYSSHVHSVWNDKVGIIVREYFSAEVSSTVCFQQTWNNYRHFPSRCSCFVYLHYELFFYTLSRLRFHVPSPLKYFFHRLAEFPHELAAPTARANLEYLL